MDMPQGRKKDLNQENLTAAVTKVKRKGGANLSIPKVNRSRYSSAVLNFGNF